MVFLFFGLLTIFLAGLVVGHALLVFLDPKEHFDRSGDRVLLSVWVGVLLICNLFLAISLVLPLSPLVGLCTLAALLAVAFGRRQNRSFLKSLLRGRKVQLVAMAMLVLGVSISGTQTVRWYDSGLYYLQAIKWLSEYGLVPGLALIHNRFGFISSWFTLAAPLNHGVFEGRIATLPGSFCLLMLLLGWTLAFFRIAQCRGKGQDWFLMVASSLAIPLVILRGLVPSPAPDLPVTVLVVVVGWTIYAISDIQRGNSRCRRERLGMLPLILSAGAVTVKLSAFPLLAVASVFYLLGWPSRLTVKSLAIAVVVTACVLLPLAAGGVRTSGCALYPTPYFCADLPWSLGAVEAKSEALLIRDWLRWNGPTPVGVPEFSWIVPWFLADKVFSLLLLATFIAALVLLCTQRKNWRRDGCFLAFAVTGTIFMFIRAPSWRFGLGYTFLIPSLVLSRSYDLLNSVVAQFKINKIPWLFFAAGVTLVYVVPSYELSRVHHRMFDKYAQLENASDRQHIPAIFLPPKVLMLEYDRDETGEIVESPDNFIREQVNDVFYYRSSGGEMCWDEPLPCSPDGLKEIQLRDPRLGIAGGFVRAISATGSLPGGNR